MIEAPCFGLEQGGFGCALMRLIEERTTDGRIDFHEHISIVREEASNWLEGIEKNGIDHSKRLEGYLDSLIPDEFKKKLKPAFASCCEPMSASGSASSPYDLQAGG